MSYIDRVSLNAKSTKIKENKNASNTYINTVTYNNTLYPLRENNSSYRYMSVKIDTSISDSALCCTYIDDAETMLPGSAEWDEFFGHFPCTLNEEDKKVIKLNPDDYSKDIDGNERDEENADTMVCFPLRGINIFNTGKYVYVSMTDNPDDDSYQYYAHTYNGIIRKNMYISAYKAFKTNPSLQFTQNERIYSRHIDGINYDYDSKIVASLTQTDRFISSTTGGLISNIQKAARNKGFGYDMYGYYQYMYLQVMYILKYKNLDSQSVIGRGYVNKSTAEVIVGRTDAYGMDSEIKRNEVGPDFTYCSENFDIMSALPAYHVKLFGLEDLWGNRWTILDNIKSVSNTGISDTSYSLYVSNSSGNIITNTVSYKPIKRLSPIEWRGWITKPYGNNDLGFYPLSMTKVYSSNSLFSDETTIRPVTGYTYMGQGGYWAELCSAGMFLQGLILKDTSGSNTIRFCYFEN